MTRLMTGPDPNNPQPLPDHPRVCFLKPVVKNPLIEIGDYTYYDDPVSPETFEDKCVHYHYDFIGDKLVIGKFCAIAAGVSFIMNGANHPMAGFSTFPFEIFDHGWEDFAKDADPKEGFRGDTVIGHDVWIGRDASFMPGVEVGHGAIIAAKSVVASDVPPFGVVAGNPARLIRMRFDDHIIDDLLDIAWWDWPLETISAHLKEIRGADMAALKKAAPKRG